MAADEHTAARLREATRDLAGVSEKPMMGGLCFFVSGNMLGGADQGEDGKGRFMFRVGKESEAEALARIGATIVQLGGRRMGGMIFVREDACNKAALKKWITLALRFVGQLPPK